MRKVLIAEDDMILRKIIEVILIDGDFQLIYATSGAQVLEMAQAENPDVIVTKLKLPGVSGIELLQRLKSEEMTAHIPVILIGANEELPDMKQSLDFGATAHLTRPFSPMKFLAHLDLALREHRQ
jgi:DNA-binding response OmpR family regulator